TCCTAATARWHGPRSCVPRRSRPPATHCAPSSKKSATSLPSPSSPTPVPLAPNRASAARWAWVVGLGVTVGLLAWALHGVSARDLVEGVRRANRGLILATVALATLTFPIRTVRWRFILRDVGGGAYPLRPLWHATAIGFMANNLLPVRAGEFARAYAASRQLPVRFSTALASVGVERMFDGLMLVSLMAVALASSAFPRQADIGRTSASAITTTAAAFFGIVLLGIIGFGLALPSSPGFVGVFEAATRATLGLYGIDATRAVSYALAYHVSTFLPITLLGLYSLSQLRLRLVELRRASATDG